MNETGLNLENLVLKGLSGDRRAYADTLRETARILRPYIARRIASAADVEEILQETLLSIHKARHTYDGERPYKPWAFAIAKFRLHDHLRKAYSDQLRYAAPLEDAENISPPDVTNSSLTYESIKGEIARLPEKQATILQLLHGEGHTSREVAEKMRMTETAVKVAAHRAYKVLRKKLVE